jgi:nitrate/TMAO reductase-like tetraheme cytochrome c subunit
MSETPPHRIDKVGLFRNWLSLAGGILAISSGFAFVLLFVVDLLAHHGNPYMGILAYVVTPCFLFAGLGLIGIGYWLQWRQQGKLGAAAAPPLAFHIDLTRKRDRRILGAFAFGSVVFLFMTALGSYQTYHFTESVTFCGQACHVPMEPEYVTAQHSPHARVDCVACHVGPGAVAYFKTKVNGTRQLIHTILNDFERPIRLTSDHQRPAQETCETCHWPKKFTGELVKVNQHFLSDETNTPFTVRLLLNVGGGDPSRGAAGGIHWHMHINNKVQFIFSDEERRQIPWIRVTDAAGRATEYRTPDFTGDPAKYEVRTMDCMDCHNRPSHKFHTPNEAVDLAIASGRVSRDIPWVKAKMVEALVQPYTTSAEAAGKIRAFLLEAFPGNPRVDTVIQETLAIYNANFFPEMKADWRVHPDNIGHKEWDGCFRCHDGKHKTADGSATVKASDCTSCHVIISQAVGAEAEKPNPEGGAFIHIDSEYSDFSCAECHTGAAPK